jgi:hypothetical protein
MVDGLSLVMMLVVVVVVDVFDLEKCPAIFRTLSLADEAQLLDL